MIPINAEQIMTNGMKRTHDPLRTSHDAAGGTRKLIMLEMTIHPDNTRQGEELCVAFGFCHRRLINEPAASPNK